MNDRLSGMAELPQFEDMPTSIYVLYQLTFIIYLYFAYHQWANATPLIVTRYNVAVIASFDIHLNLSYLAAAGALMIT